MDLRVDPRPLGEHRLTTLTAFLAMRATELAAVIAAEDRRVARLTRRSSQLRRLPNLMHQYVVPGATDRLNEALVTVQAAKDALAYVTEMWQHAHSFPHNDDVDMAWQDYRCSLVQMSAATGLIIL